MSVIGRSIPAFVVADALAECISVANNYKETHALKKLIEVADDMSLITIDERNENGDVTKLTLVSLKAK